jgi:hypothetical protein
MLRSKKCAREGQFVLHDRKELDQRYEEEDKFLIEITKNFQI